MDRADREGRTLRDIIDTVPATNPDTVADSCSNSSDDDEPKCIPETPNPLGYTKMNTNTYPAGPSSRETKVEKTTTWGGRTKYQVSRPTQQAYYYMVQWRKPQTKKHKTWDGDAYVKIEGGTISMVDEEGKPMATSALIGGLPSAGVPMRIGQMEVEFDRMVPEEEFRTATCILNKPLTCRALPLAYAPSTFAKPFKAPVAVHTPKQSGGYIPATEYDARPSRLSSPGLSSMPERNLLSAIGKTVKQSSFYAAPKPKRERIVLGAKSNKERLEWGGALHNPYAEGALVMPRPKADSRIGKEIKKKSIDLVDVVVDPHLASTLRNHQREGVKFMYANVMGFTTAEAEGCILADEMGLGKTLQTIALIYTLLKQSPYPNDTSVIGKALIVCPVTLVANWSKEFKKWADKRLVVVKADSNASAVVQNFVHNKSQHVLVIGYERLRKVIKDLVACVPPIGLVVCDEGHRLKSKDNKTTKMFEQLRTRRRIILSGTPLQNDLSEYWAMVEFTCPGILGKYSAFNKRFEKAILKGRSVGCSKEAMEEGQMRAEELAKLSKEFVLRRDTSVLTNYLPSKTEYVVFIAPTKIQMDVLEAVLNPTMLNAFIRGAMQPLGLIDLLRKVCNSPMILRIKKDRDDDESKSEDIANSRETAMRAIPKDVNTKDVTASGKMQVLDRLLHNFHADTDKEKVVVVSNWTTTLNLIQELCKMKKYPYLRLDGSTPQKQRQESVDRFNREDRSQSFIFLLSAKAGGMGLNLIGASRLILFDSDWNPSTDAQAMARIHRDGQKKPVFIYRFLLTNTIDEKIYQRQITKTGLSDQMLDHTQSNKDSAKDSFSAAELRDIFTLNVRTDGCQTHDLLGCECLKAKESATSSNSNPSEKVSSLSLDDSDSDDERPNFVAASQYDPAPTPKMMKKTAEENKQKLAVLKKWHHIDGFDKQSFEGLHDNVLYDMLWTDWDEVGHNGAASTKNPSAAASASMSRASTTDGRETKKARVVDDWELEGLADQLFASDAEDEDGDDKQATSMLWSKAESDSAGSLGEKIDSDDEALAIPVPSKRKATRIASPPDESRSRSTSVLPKDMQKKHDLKEIAERGQGGRVMFVFEKITKSKM